MVLVVEDEVQREYVFFFSSRRRHTRYWRDWSSDVCSSDLKAAQGAHAAAREASSISAKAAARAAGHAVATAHMADHSLGAAIYALKSVEATGGSVDAVRAWQVNRLPPEVRELVVSALGSPR